MDRGTLLRSHRSATSASSSTRAISTTGTPATPRRRPRAAPHIGACDRRGRSARAIRTCRRSSTSARQFEIGGRAKSSRPSTRPASSAASTARSCIPDPQRRGRQPSARRRGSAERRFAEPLQVLSRTAGAIPVREHGSDYQQRDRCCARCDNAHRLLTLARGQGLRPVARTEGVTTTRYNTGQFGLGCLLARRLVEAGARFIEVTTEYIPFRTGTRTRTATRGRRT